MKHGSTHRGSNRNGENEGAQCEEESTEEEGERQVSGQRTDEEVAEEDGGQRQRQAAQADHAGHIAAVAVGGLQGVVAEGQRQWVGVRAQHLLRVAVDQLAVQALFVHRRVLDVLRGHLRRLRL